WTFFAVVSTEVPNPVTSPLAAWTFFFRSLYCALSSTRTVPAFHSAPTGFLLSHNAVVFAQDRFAGPLPFKPRPARELRPPLHLAGHPKELHLERADSPGAGFL